MGNLSRDQQRAAVLRVLVDGYRKCTIDKRTPITAKRLGEAARLEFDCDTVYTPQAVHDLCAELREPENGHWAIAVRRKGTNPGYWLAEDFTEMDELVQVHLDNIAGAKKGLAVITPKMHFGKDGV